jgi:hypothetical protein
LQNATWRHPHGYVSNERHAELFPIFSLLTPLSGYVPEKITSYNGSSGVTVQNKPIKKGIFVKDNNWQYTFLCQNCMANSTLAFDQKANKVELSYVVVSSHQIL